MSISYTEIIFLLYSVLLHDSLNSVSYFKIPLHTIQETIHLIRDKENLS